MRIIDTTGAERTETAEELAALGTLTPETINAVRHDADPGTPEVGHYEVTAEYPATGGREVVWIVDTPAVPPADAWWETETVLRFVPYADAELAARRIAELTAELRTTDGEVLDALEALFTAQTPADALAAIAAAAETITETLAARRDLRARIAAIKEG